MPAAQGINWRNWETCMQLQGYHLLGIMEMWWDGSHDHECCNRGIRGDKGDTGCLGRSSPGDGCGNVLWECRKRNPKHKPLTSKLLLSLLPKMHDMTAAMLAKKSCFGVLFSS